MCNVKLEVYLPIVNSFLVSADLRCGSITIVIWTIIRSLLCTFFAIVAILEVYLKRKLPCGGILVTNMRLVSVPLKSVMVVYFLLVGLMLTEAFLFVYSWYLARGIYTFKSKYFVDYLVCRPITWVLEVILLVCLCVYHKFLIGWYLGILFFVILEVYSFIVVYSYYCELWELEHPCCKVAPETEEPESIEL